MGRVGRTVGFGILCGIESDGSGMDVWDVGRAVEFGILYGVESDGSGMGARGGGYILWGECDRGGRW